MEFADGSVGRLARQLVTERNARLGPAARLFACLVMALYDSYGRVGREVRVQRLAAVYGHRGGRDRRQPVHWGRSELGAAADAAAVSRVRFRHATASPDASYGVRCAT